MEELSVLDYVKTLLSDWRRLPARLSEIARLQAEGSETSSAAAKGIKEGGESAEAKGEPGWLASDSRQEIAVTSSAQQEGGTTERVAAAIPVEPAQAHRQQLSRAERLAILSSLSALTLALWAQTLLEPPNPNATWGIVLYGATVVVLLFAGRSTELEAPPSSHPQSLSQETEFRLHLPAFGAGLVCAALAFLTFGGGDFNTLNLFLWGLSLALMVRAFYPYTVFRLEWLAHAVRWLQKQEWEVRITRWTVLLLLTAGILLFFRFYRLAEVPPEMVSDHAEKLLDVADVLDGKWHIFYPRNTGREAFQMFLTAAVAKLFGTGLSFMSLKLGTTIAGLMTLVYIYLIGKEIANRRVGWFAVVLAGISYWLNVITRVGLRFSLYPLFVAPTFYYLIRALRRPNPKDFILCGFFLGLGLHGYSPFRLVPLVVVVAIGLALLHRSTPQIRRALIIGLLIVTIISLIVFLPLLRYALQNPEIFFYRGLTRLTDVEKPLDRPAIEIFFSNLWKALIMFFWNNGNVWVVSIPGRPALSVVPAALFFIGSFLALVRYLRRRDWLDLFLLLSIPLLLLPSVLSLAFPDENPILNRTSGAIIPVFLLAGLGLEALIRPLETAFRTGWRRTLGWLLALFLLGLSLVQDYDLIFRQYYTQYAQSAWNTSQIGKIIHEFATTIGTPDTAWVVAYPHWVDTRLVGINAGFPLKDYAIWPDQLMETLAFQGPLLFIVKPEDSAALEALQRLYPWGTFQEQRSPWEGKNFYIYFVPPGTIILPEGSTLEP